VLTSCHISLKEAIWLSPFQNVCDSINESAFKTLVDAGNFHYRCIATHQSGAERETEATLNKYFKYSNPKKYGATFIDLAVGMRVKCTDNLATELGIYNGATGTVIDIAFNETIPPNKFKLVPDESLAREAMKNRPLPVVTVRLDNDKVNEELFPGKRVVFTPVKKCLYGKKDNAVCRY